jgi:hypothetical protein
MYLSEWIVEVGDLDMHVVVDLILHCGYKPMVSTVETASGRFRFQFSSLTNSKLHCLQFPISCTRPLMILTKELGGLKSIWL